MILSFHSNWTFHVNRLNNSVIIIPVWIIPCFKVWIVSCFKWWIVHIHFKFKFLFTSKFKWMRNRSYSLQSSIDSGIVPIHFDVRKNQKSFFIVSKWEISNRANSKISRIDLKFSYFKWKSSILFTSSSSWSWSLQYMWKCSHSFSSACVKKKCFHFTEFNS